MLRAHAYRNYMVGKWHVTPLTESGATGPFDGWPLGRGFDRFYGFLDAETDQYAPELVSDNTHIDPPGTYADGYHLTSDLVDQSIRFIADHIADRPDLPWLTWVALGACHAPHQAPADIIKSYDEIFAHGWDVEREQRMARQKAMGIVPQETRMPARNDGVKAWDEHSADERRVFTRLQSAFAGMLDHADRHLARLIGFLDTAGIRDNTLILVLSDNGASQEGGPLGFVNAMGPYNFRPEPIAEKMRRIDDIGGPDSHSNFPHGWAMASNTPLRRYKQNTHGGGIRDPFVMSWPKRIAAKGELRHQFVHASDLAPTLLELIGVSAPAEIAGIAANADRGRELCALDHGRIGAVKIVAAIFRDVRPSRALAATAGRRCPSIRRARRSRTTNGSCSISTAISPRSTTSRRRSRERLAEMIKLWWSEAEKHNVLPLDDRFAAALCRERRAVPGRAQQFHLSRRHGPRADRRRARCAQPQLHHRGPCRDRRGRRRGRADRAWRRHFGLQPLHQGWSSGARSQYRRRPRDRRARTARCRQARIGSACMSSAWCARKPPAKGSRTGISEYTLLIDGEPAGSLQTQLGFHNFISWSGLDIGRDRSSPVSHYDAPFEFTGQTAAGDGRRCTTTRSSTAMASARPKWRGSKVEPALRAKRASVAQIAALLQ